MSTPLRIWASEDGESPLEDADLGFAESRFLPTGPPMLLSPQTPASSFFVALVRPGWDAGWHTAQVGERAVYLAGHGQIAASDEPRAQ